MSDELMELPDGWVWINFSEVIEKIKRGPSKKCNTEGLGVRYITSGNLQEGELRLDLDYKFLDDLENIDGCRLVSGDLILNCVNSLERIGKSAIFREIHGEAIVGFNNYALELDNRLISSEYANICCQSDFFQKQLYFLVKRAVNQVSFATRELNLLEIPLPSLNEQKRIVAKIASLRERSQKARSALSAIPELCDKFRQSILAAAFRGDLTADWREQNPDVDPASVLLERIRLERQYRWNQETSKLVKYKEPALVDREALPNLPCNWTWANLDQILFSLRNGLPKPPAEEEPGIPILRISAVRSREVNLCDVRFYRLDESENVDTYFLSNDDLLFTRYNGNRNFVGVCGMVRHLNSKLLYPDKLIRGRLVNPTLCLPEYIELACNFGVSRKFIDSHIKTSAGQHGIAGGDIKLTPIPLPPIAEQHVIVNSVKQQFSSLRKLTVPMEGCKRLFQVLDRSILAKAFRGELVEQDPNDEPASVLLERIRAEREKVAGNGKKAKGKANAKSRKS